MKIKHLRTLSGPNIYSSHPALVARLNFDDLTCEQISNTEFSKKLFQLMPRLQKYSYDFEGAQPFSKLAIDKEFINQIITLVAIELSHLADCDIGINKVDFRETEKPLGFCNVVVAYKSNEAMRFLLETAVKLIAKIMAGEPVEQIKKFKDERLAETRRIVFEHYPDKNLRKIIEAADKKNIPVQLIDKNSLQLGYGKDSQVVTSKSNDSIGLNAIEVDDEIDGTLFIESLYPNQAESRIPVISVTGTNGKTTVTRMIAYILREAGNRVGMTTTDGIWIGEKCVQKGDTTGPKSAKTILSDPTVEIAVLETARGGIVRRGLGYDWSDVAVITNIQADHFGQDGIENINDILAIKSLVAERVRAGGTLVLNADDDLLVRLVNEPHISSVQRDIVYFSLRPNHITIKRHTLSGGRAYTIRNGWLVEATKIEETPIIEIKEIPVALGGFAEFNLANALAAIAACRAQNLTIEQIAKSLRSFQAERHNNGRANLYEIDGAYVFIDYGHNPEAFKSLCQMTAKWDIAGRRITGIIGIPGDRANSLVMQAGRIAARGFHRLVIREDADLRGRAKGEIAQILLHAVKDEVPDCDCQIILDESEALRREITRLQKGDILVCFYENYNLVRDILDRCDARSVDRINEVLKPSFYNFRHA